MKKLALLLVTAVLSLFSKGPAGGPVDDLSRVRGFQDYRSPTATEEMVSAEPRYVAGEVIVKFKSSPGFGKSGSDFTAQSRFSSLNTVLSNYTVQTIEHLSFGRRDIISNVYKVKIQERPSPSFGAMSLPPTVSAGTQEGGYTPDSVLTLVAQLNADSNVEYAEPNYIYRTQLEPNDSRWSDQLQYIAPLMLTGAWDITTGSPEVIIAISDTGIDYTHPDLVENIWVNDGETLGDGIDNDENGFVDDIHGYDFHSSDGDPMDDHGHGTHCAGIAGAKGNNRGGIAGVCWNCKLMAVKGLGADGSGFTDRLARGIIYAVDNGASVISMSWGGGESSRLLQEALNYADSNGVLLVAAAGNDSSSWRGYPAGYDNVIAVGAVDHVSQRASFSNYGSWVDVAAPGVGILSTVPQGDCQLCDSSGYKNLSGTSMATPHVAGLLGLVVSKGTTGVGSEFGNGQAQTLLHSTARFSSSPDQRLGTGIISAYDALQRDDVPEVSLSSSLDDLEIAGAVDVRGVVHGALGYRLSVGRGVYADDWILLDSKVGRGEKISFDWDVAFDWNTEEVQDGPYTLRLSVNGIGDQQYFDEVVVDINNIFITTPLSNDVVGNKQAIKISGSVGGAGFQNYLVEWGEGSAPSSWSSSGITLVDGGETQVRGGELAYWDAFSLGVGEYSLRLTINFSSGASEEYVRSLRVDPGLKAGWPVRIHYDFREGEGGYVTGGTLEPVVSDINNDGLEEIIVYSGGDPPKLYVFGQDGELLPGWPAEDPWGAILGSMNTRLPVVGDLNNDGSDEILVVRGWFPDCPGFDLANRESKLIAYSADGGIIDGWPRTVPLTLYRPRTVLSDLNKDGRVEIIIVDSGRVLILDNQANLLLGWPKDLEVNIGTDIESYPTIGNFDGDSDLEIVVAVPTPACSSDENKPWGVIYIFNMDGSLVNGWPQETLGEIFSSPAVADLDGDGEEEIVIATLGNTARGNLESSSALHVFDRYGNSKPGWPQLPEKSVWSSPAIGDLDGDGDLEIVVVSYHHAYSEDRKVYVFHHDGRLAGGWPQGLDQTNLNLNLFEIYSTAIGNLDVDADPEIVLVAHDAYSCYSKVSAWNFGGDLVLHGFPKTIERGSSYPVIVDLDRDGKVELVTTSAHDKTLEPMESKHRGSIYVWDLEGEYHPETMHWPTFHHDNQRTGLYTPPVPLKPAMSLQDVIVNYGNDNTADVNRDNIVNGFDFSLVRRTE